MGGTFRGALGHQGFRRLLVAHATAMLAQFVLVMAVGMAVLERTGSGAWLSLTSALGLLPYLLASGVAGAVADRYPRARVLAVSAGLRTVLAVTITAGLGLGAPVPLLVLLTVALATAGTVGYPAVTAATTELLRDDELPSANALVTGLDNLTWVAGPGVLGLALLADLPLWVAASAATTLPGAAAVSVARVPSAWPLGAPGTGRGLDRGHLVAGALLVARDRRVRTPILVVVLDGVLYGYVAVAVVLLSRDAFDAGTKGVGWLNGGLTVGAALAFLVVGRLLRRIRPALALCGALLVTVVGVVLLAVAPSLATATLLLVVVGLAGLVTEVAAATALQRATPPALTARVFGVSDSAVVAAIATGSALAGPLAMLMGLGPSLVTVGALVGLGDLVLLRMIRRDTKPAAATAPATDLALSLPVPRPGLPAASTGSRPVRVPRQWDGALRTDADSTHGERASWSVAATSTAHGSTRS